jgi:hypothetical protein
MQFGAQLISRSQSELRVVDDQPSVRGEGYRPFDASKALGKQRVVAIHPAPSLTVVAISDIELRSSIALRRIGACERRTRFLELIALEERQSVVERALIDAYAPIPAASPPVTCATVCGCAA